MITNRQKDRLIEILDGMVDDISSLANSPYVRNPTNSVNEDEYDHHSVISANLTDKRDYLDIIKWLSKVETDG